MILISTASFYVYRVVKSYDRMQILKIETFDSVWKEKFFDRKSKTIRLTSDQDLSQLRALAQTPGDKKRFRFAEISIKLMRLEDKNSSMSIDEILQSISDYKSSSDIDNDFSEQKAINQKIMNESEKFVQDLIASIQSLSISDDGNVLVYDQNLREVKKFSEIETLVKWAHLKNYNKSVESLNLAIEKQVKENQESDTQRQIIDLKVNFDKFLELIESTKQSLKNDFFSVKDLKRIIRAIDKTDLSKSEWLNDQSAFSYRDSNTQIVTSLSDKFFEENADLSDLKDLAKNIKIVINVQVNNRYTNNKSEDSKSQKMTINSTDISSLTDESLIRKSSISNFKVNLRLDQTKTIYKESESREDSSSKSSSSQSSSDKSESSETYASSNERR